MPRWWPFAQRRPSQSQAVVRLRAWARLPPLSATVDLHPPVLAALFETPDIATTRQLLSRDSSIATNTYRGVVIGLAHSSPPHPIDLPHPTRPAPVARPARKVRAVREKTEHKPLTLAVDEYVGEPLEPTVPYKTSSFDRLLTQFQGSPDALAQAAMLALGGLSATVPEPPRPGPPPVEQPDPHPPVLRRATLAQSRRMGLAGRPDQLPKPEPIEEPEQAADPDQPVVAEQPVEAGQSVVTQRPVEAGQSVVAQQHVEVGQSVAAEQSVVVERAVVAEPLIVAEPGQTSLGGPPLAEMKPPPDARPSEMSPGAVKRVGRRQARPAKTQAAQTRPGEIQPDEIRPGAAPSKQLPSQQPRSDLPRDEVPRSEVPSGEAKPSEVKPGEDQSAEAQTSVVQPGAVQSGTGQPSEMLFGEMVLGEAPSEPAPPHQASPSEKPPGQSPSRTWPGEMPAKQASHGEAQPDQRPSSTGPVRRKVGIGAPLATFTHRQPVPNDIVTTFRSQFGADVADVPVHRGAAVSTVARSASARAFTQGGEVYLPDEAGELTEPEGRSLLVHELVHATQQRALGPSLPDEESPDGARLEVAAAATENWFRGQGDAPTTLVHSTTAAPTGQKATMQRAAEEPPSLDALLAQVNSESAPSVTVVSSESGPVVETSQRPPTSDHLVRRLDELANAVDELTAAQAKTLDLTDPSGVDIFTNGLYRRIRDSLRQELLVDRERAGILSDLR